MNMIYLLMKNGKVKAIKDSSDIRGYITEKVEKVMINVGLNNNQEYILVNPKKLVKRLKKCEIITELGVYIADISDNDETEMDIELCQVTKRQTCRPRTIGQLYSYLFTLNRVNEYNELIARYDDTYGYINLNLDFYFFSIKLKTDKLDLEKTFVYDDIIMPKETCTLYEISKYLRKSILSGYENDGKSTTKSFIVDYKHEKWYYINKVISENIKSSELIAYPIKYSNSYYVMNRLIYETINEVSALYVDYLYYKEDELEIPLEKVIKCGIDFNPEEFLEPLSSYGVSSYGLSDEIMLLTILPLVYNVITTICNKNDSYISDNEYDSYKILTVFSFFFRNAEQENFYSFEKEELQEFNISDFVYKIYTLLNKGW